MKRILCTLIAVLAMAATTPAGATSDTERTAIEKLLAGIDTLPSRTQLLKISQQPHTVLFALATSTQTHKWVQERATSYLSKFADRSETWGYLVTLSESAPTLLRATAISALTAGYRASRPTQLVTVLQNFLASDHAAVRRAAIWAVSRVTHRNALDALKGVTWEKRSDLRTLLSRRIAVLESKLKAVKKR